MKIISCLYTTFYFLFAASCNGNKEAVPAQTDTAEKKGSYVIQPAQQALPTDSFVNFYNAEMVEYCVPIPAMYKEDYEAATVKGVHMFFNPAEKENVITIMGLLRSDSNTLLQDYFKNTYDTAAEEGKAIETKQLLPQQNCFYIKGYWNNHYYKSRFLEITWLRKEEVIVYKAEMPLTDTAFWYRNLNKLINSNTTCK